MPDSCREQIAKAAKTALEAIPGITLERNRRDPLDDGDLPSLILFEGPEIAVNDFSSEDQYRLSLLVQGSFKGTGEAAAGAANAARASVIRALLADPSLGGLCRSLEIADPGDWIGVATTSDDTEGFTLQADVTYATAEGDPFTFAN